MNKMMKKIVMVLMGAGMVVTTLFGAIASASAAELTEEDRETHVAVVLGNHDNAPQPNLALIEGAVYQACLSQGSVTLVCDDGDPYTIVVDIPEQQKGLSASKYQAIANDQTREILTAASQMSAKTEEVDTLKAVQLAARQLSACEASEGKGISKEMIILDSCLSTTGALDFSECQLNGVISDDIVAQLDQLGELPTTEGLMIDVYTCGDTAGEQTALTAENRETLRGLWSDILSAKGGKVNMKNDLPLSTAYDVNKLPKVSTVSVVQNAVTIQSEEEVKEALDDGAVLSFDETSIAFNPGTAELADRDASKEALAYVVDYMNDHKDFKLLVCGTTACWGGESYCNDLSKQRAAAICDLLKEQGIKGERLQAAGVGYSYPGFYINDQTADGELDESIAPMNRTVKLVDMTSDTAAKILEIAAH